MITGPPGVCTDPSGFTVLPVGGFISAPPGVCTVPSGFIVEPFGDSIVPSGLTTEPFGGIIVVPSGKITLPPSGTTIFPSSFISGTLPSFIGTFTSSLVCVWLSFPAACAVPSGFIIIPFCMSIVPSGLTTLPDGGFTTISPGNITVPFSGTSILPSAFIVGGFPLSPGIFTSSSVFSFPSSPGTVIVPVSSPTCQVALYTPFNFLNASSTVMSA